MSDNILTTALIEKPFLLLDGAMGTNLFERGLVSGDEPALWNETAPEKIQSVHAEMLQYGADIILTNSFGANPFRLKLHHATDKLESLNRLAVEHVKTAITSSQLNKKIFIAGDIGPSGELLMPLGLLSEDDVKMGFADEIKALLLSGADLIWIETMSAIEEVSAIVKAADEIGGKKNLVVTMTFDTNGKTMMGISPERAVEQLLKLSPNIIAFGINCGKSPAESIYSLWQWQRHLRQVVGIDGIKTAPLMVAKANRGVPKYQDGKFIFDGTAEMMMDYGRLAYGLGARLIGGCCGTDGKTLQAIKQGIEAEIKNPQYQSHEGITPELIQKILGAIPETTLKHIH